MGSRTPMPSEVLHGVREGRQRRKLAHLSVKLLATGHVDEGFQEVQDGADGQETG